MPTSLFDSVMPSDIKLPIFQDIQDISSQDTTEHFLPISAPVPVWCAGKDALRSILEMHHEEGGTEEDQAHIFDERLKPKEATEKNQPQGRLFPWSNNLAHGAKTAIRPITPSTLMALTEPCLMGWCFTDAEENSDPNNGFREASPDALQTPHYLIQEFSYLDQTGRMTNEWGY